MSGTSIDGIDVALVRITGRELEMSASLAAQTNATLGELGRRLRTVAEQQPTTAGEIATLAWELGRLHERVIAQLLDASVVPHIIAVHGQTVYHKPPVSFQLINPAPIAARWPDATVISDLRQHDLALGGQGAPITPLADWILFNDDSSSRAIVNLGGFCNVTILPGAQGIGPGIRVPQTLRGFDLCPCNQLLDWIARKRLNVPFDTGGEAAMRGKSHPQLRESLQAHRASDRSLGTGDEAFEVLRAFMHLSPEDMLASVCIAIADNIASTIGEVEQVILAGGGALNVALVTAIRDKLKPCEVIRSDDLGIPAQMREAMAMAILGALHVDGIPITLPQITHRSAELPAVLRNRSIAFNYRANSAQQTRTM